MKPAAAIISLCFISPAAVMSPWYYRDRAARVSVEVADPPVTSRDAPVTVGLNLASLAAQAGLKGQYDPASITVVCRGVPVPIRLSESLERGEAEGTVSWVVRGKAQASCHVYFDTLANGPQPFRAYREPVGIGDNFAYNRPDGVDPLCTGMRNDGAMAADWDGDGKTDLLGRILYSTCFDDPWWGVAFWRNVGTNNDPRYDRAIRLQADGRVIQDHYGAYQLVDWNSDGRLDLLCGIGGGRESNSLKVYLNTGRRDAFGLPLLAVGPRVDWQRQGTLNYDMRLLDWGGRGVLDLFTLHNSNRIAYFENTGTRRQPRYAPVRKLTHDAGECFSFRARPAPADWNGDGLVDLVAGYTGTRNRNDSNDIPVCRFLRYRDSRGALRLGKPEVLHLEDGSEFRTPIPYHHGFEVADWDGDGKLDILANQNSINVLYRNVGTNADPRFHREFLKFYGRQILLSHHETSLKAVDWDRHGALDLVTGGESGMIYFFRRAALDACERPRVKVGAVEVR